MLSQACQPYLSVSCRSAGQSVVVDSTSSCGGVHGRVCFCGRDVTTDARLAGVKGSACPPVQVSGAAGQISNHLLFMVSDPFFPRGTASSLASAGARDEYIDRENTI